MKIYGHTSKFGHTYKLIPKTSFYPKLVTRDTKERKITKFNVLRPF